MRKFLLALGILALLCSPAMAGKNANGALIVHTNDANAFTSGVCARFETVDNPGGCEQAGTQTNKDDATPALIWCIAAFLPTANPGVTVIYFGLNHNLPPGQGYFANFGLCGPVGSIEVPDTGWPDLGGNSVAFGSGGVVGDTFFPFYLLNAFGFAGAFVGTGINPTGGYAAFVDDSNPPVQDAITQFGVVRWGTLGQNDCPDVPVQEGACCFPDGSCIVTPPGQCTGGVYQGDGTVCIPNPCPRPEACCFEDGHCEDLFAADCLARGGAPQGPGSACAGIICNQPPVPEACCFQDGSCQDLLADACTAAGGIPEGEGTACATFTCPQPPPEAACCTNGVCSVATEADCVNGGGTWDPTHPNCDGVECPPVATETTTWGAIKANYR